jgi:hypothetical protein
VSAYIHETAEKERAAAAVEWSVPMGFTGERKKVEEEEGSAMKISDLFAVPKQNTFGGGVGALHYI